MFGNLGNILLLKADFSTVLQDIATNDIKESRFTTAIGTDDSIATFKSVNRTTSFALPLLKVFFMCSNFNISSLQFFIER